MDGPRRGGAAGGGDARGRRETIAERRARGAAIDDPEIVLNAAGRFLEARSRSVAEVRSRLRGAGYRAELVDAAIARLLAMGFLDDATFGRTWIQARERSRPRGEAALRRELGLKGLDRDLVNELLAERRAGGLADGRPGHPAPGAEDGGAPEGSAERATGDGTTELERDPDERAAERLLSRRAAALARVADPRQRRQRAYALLARNGFAPDVCRTVASAFVASPGWGSADGLTDDSIEADAGD